MTSATRVASRSAARIAPTRFVDLLAGEWIKLSSVPSTWIAVIGMMALGSGGGIAAVMNTVGFSRSEGFVPEFETVAYNLTMISGALCPVFAGILGVVVLGGEYSSGTIQPTMLASPTRLRVLAAKALLLFALVAVAAAVMIFGAWLAVAPMVRDAGLDVSLATPELLGTLLGVVAYLALTAVFGVGVAAVLRSMTAGSILVFALVFLGPALSMLLPAGPLSSILRALVIGNGGYSMVQPPIAGAPFANDQGYLSPPAGYLLVIGWTAVAVIGGAAALRKRDV